jgi:lantibiotic modifying enzyme
MPPRHRKAASDYYDLGVAHGVPGVVGLLARACAAGVGADRARPLLDSAVSWLLAQRQPAGTGARFPAWIAPDTLRHTPDPAWCYGDLGIAATVLMAARCTGEASWEDEALALARPAPTPGILSQISDAQLCHGAAGVAHLFNRMFQATGEDWLKRAALAWLRRAVDLRRPGEKLAGFSALHEARDGTVRRVAHRGFLHGVAGIGLALLAASSPIEPAWDRVLLLR